MPVYEFTCQRCGRQVAAYRPPSQPAPRYCSKQCSDDHHRATRQDRIDRDTLYDLYVSQRLSHRQVAERLGVTPKLIKDYLKRHQIPTRRPMETYRPDAIRPTEEEFRRMYCEQFMSYDEIAQQCNVDPSAVQYWRRQFDIPPRSRWETRRKGPLPPKPTADELRLLYTEAGYSIDHIAKLLGYSAHALRDEMGRLGIPARLPGYSQVRHTCDDGHCVLSGLEKHVDNWLFHHGIPHTYEPKLSFRGWADFLVGTTYIEVWGMTYSRRYAERRARKEELYAEHGLRLIGLEPLDVLRHLDDRLGFLLTC